MKHTKVYVALPMAGKPDLNRHLADEIAEHIEQVRNRIARRPGTDGIVAVLPHEIEVYQHDGPCPDGYPSGGGGGHSGHCYLRADLIEMLGCDAVVMGPGWAQSRGASAEYATADAAGMPIYAYSPAIEQVDATIKPLNAHARAAA